MRRLWASELPSQVLILRGVHDPTSTAGTLTVAAGRLAVAALIVLSSINYRDPARMSAKQVCEARAKPELLPVREEAIRFATEGEAARREPT